MSHIDEHSSAALGEANVHPVRVPKQVVCTSKSLMSRFDVAPFPMCITQTALDAIRDTIGSLPPETGGKLFGPIDKMGIDLFEFDEQGSSDAGVAVYAPNARWGQGRRDYHIVHGEPRRQWWGDVHSHPGDSNTPSGKSGPGLGDMGYAEQVFAQNEAIQWFFMPIVNHQDNKVFISPYIISRYNPTTPLIAPSLDICSDDDFPEAEFALPFHLRTIAQKINEIGSDIPDSGPEPNVVGDLSKVREQIAALQAQIDRNTIHPVNGKGSDPISTIIQLQYVQTGILGALLLLALTASIIAIWPQKQPEPVTQVEATPIEAPAQQTPVIETPVRQIPPVNEGYHH